MRHVEYQGEKLPFTFSPLVIMRFQQETGKTLADLDNELALLEPLFYHALKRGAEREGNYKRFLFWKFKVKYLKFTRSEVANILEDKFEELFEGFKDEFKTKETVKKK